MFSDGIGGRLKALASTKLKVETANRQSSNRVRAYRTHPTRWFLSVWRSHARSWLGMQATACSVGGVDFQTAFEAV